MKTMTLLAGLALLLVGALLVAGCTGTGGPATPTPTQIPSTTAPTATIGTPIATGATASSATTAPATAGSYVPSGARGKISVTGSTTVLPIAQALAEAYLTLNPDADVQVSGGGSGVGVQAAGGKTAEIGMSSRNVQEAEKAKYPDLRVIPMARDGIVMIVHPSNAVSQLSLAQIREIYSGKVTNWKDVGGPAQPIVLIGRDAASGTREFFNSAIMGNTSTTPSMLEKNSNGAVKSSVSPNPGAIGYVGMGYVDTDGQAAQHHGQRHRCPADRLERRHGRLPALAPALLPDERRGHRAREGLHRVHAQPRRTEDCGAAGVRLDHRDGVSRCPGSDRPTPLLPWNR